MFLETMTGKPNVHTMHPSQHLHPICRHSSSLSYPLNAHGRLPSGLTILHLHPSINHVLQPNTLPGQGTIVQHIFMQLMTGPPLKKSMLTVLSSNSSAMTMISTSSLIPSLHHGVCSHPCRSEWQCHFQPICNWRQWRLPHNQLVWLAHLPDCRQCGLPGRYKDGQCIEKWGPGPESPGTICN